MGIIHLSSVVFTARKQIFTIRRLYKTQMCFLCMWFFDLEPAEGAVAIRVILTF